MKLRMSVGIFYDIVQKKKKSLNKTLNLNKIIHQIKWRTEYLD